MGVHTLWDVLVTTGRDNVSVNTLEGKRLAVDLSVWIVELKQSKCSAQVRNAYIRNLFFRTIELLKEGVELVFVMDGRAPDMKHQAMVARQQNQYGSLSSTANLERPGLSKIVCGCVEMLKYLGLPCIQSKGEAEAMCAYLNSQGLVDGCLTEDNDFFLYGGKTLYRRLRKENKMYRVDVYDMDVIKEDLGLVRTDLVALALLLGCDYDLQGVKCVGKETGMALVHLLKDRGVDVLDRLQGWRENTELIEISEKLSAQIKHEPHCSKCKHLGRISSPEVSGCNICRTQTDCLGSCPHLCKCDWDTQESLKREHKLEMSVRQKSIHDGGFPNRRIIDEYLNPDMSACSEINEQCMDIPALIKYMNAHLGWSREYVLGKLVPVTILRQLRDTENDRDIMFTPIRILKACKENHVECYQVTWDKTDRNLWAGADFATNVEVKIPKTVLACGYPEMVTNYEENQNKKKSTAGKKRKPKTDLLLGQSKLTKFTKIKKKLNLFNDMEDTEDICNQDNDVALITENPTEIKTASNKSTLSKVDAKQSDTQDKTDKNTESGVNDLVISCMPERCTKNKGGRHYKKKKCLAVKASQSGTSIKSYFKKEATLFSGSRTVEFKQNDTNAFASKKIDLI